MSLWPIHEGSTALRVRFQPENLVSMVYSMVNRNDIRGRELLTQHCVLSAKYREDYRHKAQESVRPECDTSLQACVLRQREPLLCYSQESESWDLRQCSRAVKRHHGHSNS